MAVVTRRAVVEMEARRSTAARRWRQKAVARPAAARVATRVAAAQTAAWAAAARSAAARAVRAAKAARGGRGETGGGARPTRRGGEAMATVAAARAEVRAVPVRAVAMVALEAKALAATEVLSAQTCGSARAHTLSRQVLVVRARDWIACAEGVQVCGEQTHPRLATSLRRRDHANADVRLCASAAPRARCSPHSTPQGLNAETVAVSGLCAAYSRARAGGDAGTRGGQRDDGAGCRERHLGPRGLNLSPGSISSGDRNAAAAGGRANTRANTDQIWSVLAVLAVLAECC